jgi:glycosyltransferase involved in cell wall biosynthesis
MRILIIVDKQGSAIDRLAQSIKRNLPHQQVIVCPIHPKRNDIETIAEAQKLMMWADVIHVNYWKSGQLLRSMFPTEFMAKPRILHHHNPYDAVNEENKFYDIVISNNKEIHDKIPFSYLVPNCIDLSFFKFNDEYTQGNQVMMSVARIEGKKGIFEVAKACKELQYPFKLIGRVSKAEYMKDVMSISEGNTTFIENASEEELRKAYYDSAIHVCNSVDNFESGTMPILEAMACGTPVLTRMIGHVPDLFNGGNMQVRMGKTEDMEDLKEQLKLLMENREWRIKMREKAWDTVKNRDDRRMTLEIQKLYIKLYKPNYPLVSIIIPTKDNPQSFVESLLGAVAQDYGNFEIIVADSGDTSIEKIILAVKKQTEVPIKYIQFQNKDNYTLAEARNRAIIEADGKIIVFCDDRLKMKKNAVTIFVTYHRPRTWFWGSKDKAMKSFVENFSCISRDDLVRSGMFCERIQWYGGMTQEVRERFELRNNIEFIFMPEAEAESIKRSHSKNSRRSDIIEAKFLVYKLYQK